MHGAPSVLIFTVVAGLGQGLFFWLTLSELCASSWGLSPLAPAQHGMAGLLCLLLMGAGLLASFFHLGHPERAWRAAVMWRTSWLSREVIVLPLLMAVIAAWTCMPWLMPQAQSLQKTTALLGLVLCLALWICTGMIYACLRFLQEWAHPLTWINFITMGLASGAFLLLALSHSFWPQQPQDTLSAWLNLTLIMTSLAIVLRLLSWWRNRCLVAKSTLHSALGIQKGPIRQITQGSSAGTFNNREFFHGKSERFFTLTSLWALMGGGILPILLLLMLQMLTNKTFSDGSALSTPLIAWTAVVIQCSGLMAERWLFFAQARHPQNLYYQQRG
jgi:DMSO reductase anchor subunit